MSSIACPDESMDPTPPITYAPFPFDDEKADLILRTSDRVHFRVYSSNLAFLSSWPIFKEMATLSATEDNLLEKVDGRPCIELDDHSGCLYQLLTWCDPRTLPAPTSLEDYQSALRLADKYGMGDTSRVVKSTMVEPFLVERSINRSILRADPLGVYETAIRYECKPLAQLAAQELVLQVPCQGEWVTGRGKPEFAAAHQHLYSYYFSCTLTAQRFTRREEWNPVIWPEMAGFKYTGCCSGTGIWKSYLTEYMDRIAPKLRDHPTGAIALDLESLGIVRAAMERCSSCRMPHKQREFQILLRSLVQKIDHATSQVQLGFD